MSGCLLKNSSPKCQEYLVQSYMSEMCIINLLFSSFRKIKETMDVIPTLERIHIKEELIAIYSS